MSEQHKPDLPPPFRLHRPPPDRTGPFVCSSPHSGRHYPDAFKGLSRLGDLELRRSEDCYVNDLFAAAPDHGMPLIEAIYPRAFIDLNREAFELDPLLFHEPLPTHANTKSDRVTVGLGTIPRVVALGVPIYHASLPLAEAEKRIRQIYRPYHAALATLLQQAYDRYGWYALIDCHSMPSRPLTQSRSAPVASDGIAFDTDADIVLGDRYGASCDARLIDCVEDILCHMGYKVSRNVPYAGGFCTSHYGNRDKGCHALQIEINRALYLDEKTLEKHEGYHALAADMDRLMARLTRLDLSRSRPMAAE